MPKIGSCQHWFGVFVSVGHKGVTGHNKYKHITYRTGAGKTFLDKNSFVAEDTVLYHTSSGWVSIAFRQDPSDRTPHTGPLTQDPSHRTPHTGPLAQDPSHRTPHTG